MNKLESGAPDPASPGGAGLAAGCQWPGLSGLRLADPESRHGRQELPLRQPRLGAASGWLSGLTRVPERASSSVATCILGLRTWGPGRGPPHDSADFTIGVPHVSSGSDSQGQADL